MSEADRPVHKVSLGELAAFPGLPSEPTLRKMITDNPDFPVISRGKNGVAYEFDLIASIQFIKSLEAKKEEADRARAEEVRQFGLDLLGADAAADMEAVGMTASERKALLEYEFIAMKLGRERGEFVRKASVDAAFAAVFQKLNAQRRKLVQRMTRRVELSREQIGVMESILEADLHELADAFEEMGTIGDAAPEAAADTAV